MVHPRLRPNRNNGTATGIWLAIAGLLAFALISFVTGHQSPLARYVGSALYMAGVIWILVVTSVADYKNGEAIAPNFPMALVYCCIPLELTLGALGVVWWLRLIIALAEAVASLVLFHIVFRLTLKKD